MSQGQRFPDSEVRAAADRIGAALADLVVAVVSAASSPDHSPSGVPTPQREALASQNVWLTTAEAAELAKRHPVTVSKALATGELHGHQTVRRGRWGVKSAAVDAWILGRDGIAACGCDKLKQLRTARDR